MSAPKIIVGDEARGRATAQAAGDRNSLAWSVLWWVGGFFFVAGLVDIGLAFYPPEFGNPIWRFAAFASVANGLPLPMVGLLTATMAALAGNQLGRARLAMVLTAIVAIGLLALLIGFGTAAGTAYAQTPGNAQSGVAKGIFKTVVFTVVFGLASGASSLVVAKWLRTFSE